MDPSSSSLTVDIPKMTGRHRKRDSDIFAELPDDILSIDEQSEKLERGGDGSLFEKLIISPLTFFTFLISIFLTTYKERSWRIAQHDDGSSSILTRLLNGEPYQITDLQQSSDSTDGNDPVPTTGSGIWFTQRKHRKLARFRIAEAFSMQRRVTIVLVIWTLVAFLLLVWILQKFVHYFR